MPYQPSLPEGYEERIVNLAKQEGRSPKEISTTIPCSLSTVYRTLARRGIDWLRTDPERSGVGRPAVPLRLGQRTHATVAFKRGRAQVDIAFDISASVPRVRRFLIETGLYKPQPRNKAQVEKRRADILAAVSDYLNTDMTVTAIVAKHNLSSSELYRELKIRGVELRGNPGRRPKQRPAAQEAQPNGS